MIKCVAIDRQKMSDGRYVYLLQAEDGTQDVFDADKIKVKIHNKEMEVINLQVTSDNRLIYKGEDIPAPQSTWRQRTIHVYNEYADRMVADIQSCGGEYHSRHSDSDRYDGMCHICYYGTDEIAEWVHEDYGKWISFDIRQSRHD